MRIKITLAYDGTGFFGSQVQNEANRPTIFGELERVLKTLGITSIPVASSRTDRGVHATGQVCHLDLPDFWSNTQKLIPTLNSILPKSIHIKKIQKVRNDFHARYDATSRVYRYIIKTGPSNPFEHRFVTFLPTIDFEKMKKSIDVFVGTHNFKAFQKTGSDVKTSIRTIYNAFAYKHKNYIILHFEANGFLRSQIRMMVAALLQYDAKTIEKMLCEQTPCKIIKPAPSQGLYLAKINYKGNTIC